MICLAVWKTGNYVLWFLLIFQRRLTPWNMKFSLKNYDGLVFLTSIYSGLRLTLKKNSEDILCKFHVRAPPVTVGVPQGSILGPLLFIVYINELPEIVKNGQVSIYADDTILYCFSSSTTAIENSLNADLAAVTEWLNMNKLTLNLVKTKLMLLGSEKKCKNLSLSVLVSGSEINEVHQLEYLGVIFTSNLNWWAHVQKTSKKINKRLGLLKRTKHLLPLNARILL